MSNGELKIRSRYLSQTQYTNIYRSHTVKYKPIDPADRPPQLEFNCSGHSDYYIDLNSVRLLLRFKLVKLMEHVYPAMRPIPLAVWITCYFSCSVLLAYL